MPGKWRVHRPTSSRGPQAEILLDLNDTQGISPAFGLDRDYIVRTATVYADVNFVGFDLSDARHSCAKVTLECMTRDPGEHIDKAIVAESGKKRLFVVQSVHRDDTRRGIWHFGLSQDRGGRDQGDCAGHEAILRPSGRTDEPFSALRRLL